MNSSVFYEEDVIKMKLKSTKDIFRIPNENFNLKDKTWGVRGEVLDFLLSIFTKGGREGSYIGVLFVIVVYVHDSKYHKIRWNHLLDIFRSETCKDSFIMVCGGG